MSNPYEETRRFTNTSDSSIDEIREGFNRFTDYGFEHGWADDVIKKYEKQVVALCELTESKDPCTEILNLESGGHAVNRDQLVETFSKHKWLSLTQFNRFERELFQSYLNQIQNLSDGMLYDLYKNFDAGANTFEDFKSKVKNANENLKRLNENPVMNNSFYAYDTIPEVGEVWAVEVVKQPTQVIGVVDLANNPSEFKENFRVWRTGEVIGLEAPEDKEVRAKSHPFARVDVDGTEYLLPPAALLENVTEWDEERATQSSRRNRS